MEKALKLTKEKIAKAHAEAIAAVEAEKKKKDDVAVALGERWRLGEEAKLQREEAERKAREEAERKAEEEAVLLLAEAKARTDVEAKAATDADSSSKAKGIFIQLPGLDALSAKVDTVADASVKLVVNMNEANTFIISAVHNIVLT